MSTGTLMTLDSFNNFLSLISRFGREMLKVANDYFFEFSIYLHGRNILQNLKIPL